MRHKVVRHLGYKCIGPTITVSKIEAFQKKLQDKKFNNYQQVFSILKGETRLKILWLLTREKELCVCDLADILNTTVSAVSHQLKLLRKTKLVKIRKDAQTIYYSLNKNLPQINKLMKEVITYD